MNIAGRRRRPRFADLRRHAVPVGDDPEHVSQKGLGPSDRLALHLLQQRGSLLLARFSAGDGRNQSQLQGKSSACELNTRPPLPSPSPSLPQESELSSIDDG